MYEAILVVLLFSCLILFALPGNTTQFSFSNTWIANRQTIIVPTSVDQSPLSRYSLFPFLDEDVSFLFDCCSYRVHKDRCNLRFYVTQYNIKILILIYWYILLNAIGFKPVDSCRYTFTHKQFTEQHNETEHNIFYTRWFKYDRDSFVCKHAAVSPGHIWTNLYL